MLSLRPLNMLRGHADFDLELDDMLPGSKRRKIHEDFGSIGDDIDLFDSPPPTSGLEPFEEFSPATHVGVANFPFGVTIATSTDAQICAHDHHPPNIFDKLFLPMYSEALKNLDEPLPRNFSLEPRPTTIHSQLHALFPDLSEPHSFSQDLSQQPPLPPSPPRSPQQLPSSPQQQQQQSPPSSPRSLDSSQTHRAMITFSGIPPTLLESDISCLLTKYNVVEVKLSENGEIGRAWFPDVESAGLALREIGNRQFKLKSHGKKYFMEWSDVVQVDLLVPMEPPPDNLAVQPAAVGNDGVVIVMQRGSIMKKKSKKKVKKKKTATIITAAASAYAPAASIKEEDAGDDKDVNNLDSSIIHEDGDAESADQTIEAPASPVKKEKKKKTKKDTKKRKRKEVEKEIEPKEKEERTERKDKKKKKKKQQRPEKNAETPFKPMTRSAKAASSSTPNPDLINTEKSTQQQQYVQQSEKREPSSPTSNASGSRSRSSPGATTPRRSTEYVVRPSASEMAAVAPADPLHPLHHIWQQFNDFRETAVKLEPTNFTSRYSRQIRSYVESGISKSGFTDRKLAGELSGLNKKWKGRDQTGYTAENYKADMITFLEEMIVNIDLLFGDDDADDDEDEDDDGDEDSGGDDV